MIGFDAAQNTLVAGPLAQAVNRIRLASNVTLNRIARLHIFKGFGVGLGTRGVLARLPCPDESGDSSAKHHEGLPNGRHDARKQGRHDCFQRHKMTPAATTTISATATTGDSLPKVSSTGAA